MAQRKRLRAAVIGGSGYGGAEMIRRLLIHPEVKLIRVASVDHVGEPLSEAHPSLEGATELVFEDLPPAKAAEGVDVVLLGLPHKVTAQKVDELLRAERPRSEKLREERLIADRRAKGQAEEPGPERAGGVGGLHPPILIDMSGDFRLRSAESYARYYGQEHPCPERLRDFVYGLPELNRERIRGARFVASPGCFATTVELGLLPLASAGLLRGVVHTQGITGSSGAGVTPGATTHHAVRAGNLRTYKPLEHQHVPEIVETLSAAGASALELRFVPVSAPLARGIFATSFVELGEEWSEDRLRRLYDEFYADEPFVRVPRHRLPEVAAVSGSNHAEVGVAAGPAASGRRTVALFSALDNLIKGGAGQAIQNMNLALGLPETLSLEDPGPWPP
jgi:N-acetyl-gamma-glutamyl-phosphate/LysW-gamma-L-alpha-aminoadipyl-6-phosphate reductase